MEIRKTETKERKDCEKRKTDETERKKDARN